MNKGLQVQKRGERYFTRGGGRREWHVQSKSRHEYDMLRENFLLEQKVHEEKFQKLMLKG